MSCLPYPVDDIWDCVVHCAYCVRNNRQKTKNEEDEAKPKSKADSKKQKGRYRDRKKQEKKGYQAHKYYCLVVQNKIRKKYLQLRTFQPGANVRRT